MQHFVKSIDKNKQGNVVLCDSMKGLPKLKKQYEI